MRYGNRFCDTCHNFTDTPESESQRVDGAFFHSISQPKAHNQKRYNQNLVQLLPRSRGSSFGFALWRCSCTLRVWQEPPTTRNQRLQGNAGLDLAFSCFFSMILSGILIENYWTPFKSTYSWDRTHADILPMDRAMFGFQGLRRLYSVIACLGAAISGNSWACHGVFFRHLYLRDPISYPCTKCKVHPS